MFAEWARLVGADVAAHCSPAVVARRRVAHRRRVDGVGHPAAAAGGDPAGPAGRRARPGGRHQAGHQRAGRAELEARRLLGPRRARAARTPTASDAPRWLR